MLVLVTGGCGFIGSHLVDSLMDAGHSVRVLDDLSTGSRRHLPAAAELVEACITDDAAVAAAARGVEAIYHLAAIASVARSNEARLATHRVNQTGTIAVLEAARAGRLPVVYASSAAVYGDLDRMPLNEAAQPRPLTAYGVDKLGSELHASVAARLNGVPNAGLRFFNVYGPRQRPDSPYSGVISIFADRVRRGLALRLHGDGGQTRDFIHVADVVRALTMAMEQCRGAAIAGNAHAEVYNICTGVPTTIAGLAEAVMAAAGRRVPIEHEPARPGDIRASVGDPTRALARLGFRAATDLPQGLGSLLDHDAAATA